MHARLKSRALRRCLTDHRPDGVSFTRPGSELSCHGGEGNRVHVSRSRFNGPASLYPRLGSALLRYFRESVHLAKAKIARLQSRAAVPSSERFEPCRCRSENLKRLGRASGLCLPGYANQI